MVGERLFADAMLLVGIARTFANGSAEIPVWELAWLSTGSGISPCLENQGPGDISGLRRYPKVRETRRGPAVTSFAVFPLIGAGAAAWGYCDYRRRRALEIVIDRDRVTIGRGSFNVDALLVTMRSNTPVQSPGFVWRKSPIVGKEGLCSRFVSQRQSAT